MKIYAITKGTYSDYHICALTVNKEKAEHLKKLYTDEYDEAFIEIFEDGEGSEPNLFWFCDRYGDNPQIYEYNDGGERIAVNKFGICGLCLYAKDTLMLKRKHKI